MATQEKPFPYVLVGMTALMGFGGIRADGGWLQVSALVGAAFLAACAIYQVWPDAQVTDESGELEDPWDDETPRP